LVRTRELWKLRVIRPVNCILPGSHHSQGVHREASPLTRGASRSVPLTGGASLCRLEGKWHASRTLANCHAHAHALHLCFHAILFDSLTPLRSSSLLLFLFSSSLIISSLSSLSLALPFSHDCPPIVINNTNQTKTGTEPHLIWHHLQVLVRWHPYRLEYDVELILVIFALQESLSPQDLRKDAPDRPANHQGRVTIEIGTSSTVSPKSLSQ